MAVGAVLSTIFAFTALIEILSKDRVKDIYADYPTICFDTSQGRYDLSRFLRFVRDNVGNVVFIRMHFHGGCEEEDTVASSDPAAPGSLLAADERGITMEVVDTATENGFSLRLDYDLYADYPLSNFDLSIGDMGVATLYGLFYVQAVNEASLHTAALLPVPLSDDFQKQYRCSLGVSWGETALDRAELYVKHCLFDRPPQPVS